MVIAAPFPVPLEPVRDRVESCAILSNTRARYSPIGRNEGGDTAVDHTVDSG